MSSTGAGQLILGEQGQFITGDHNWSENLFVAAYFALESSPSHSHETPCTPVIWCVDPVRWNRSTPGLSEYGESIHVLTTVDDEIAAYQPNRERKRSKSPVAVFGTHNSARIVAQRGTFIVWGADARPLEDFANEQEQVLLWRLSLRGDRLQWCRALESLGFSETMIYPELSALARELGRTEGRA